MQERNASNIPVVVKSFEEAAYRNGVSPKHLLRPVELLHPRWADQEVGEAHNIVVSNLMTIRFSYPHAHNTTKGQKVDDEENGRAYPRDT